MRFLVTGTNGLVGRRLATQLGAAGHAVLGVARGSRRVEGSFQYASVDLCEAPSVSAVVSEFAPDVIVNPAGMTDVDGCERDPIAAYAANVEAVATLARAARTFGAHLVHLSTDYVFDGDDGGYTVDAKPNPRGVYAMTKLGGEVALQALLPKDKWTIARTAVVSGWPSTGKNNFGFWLISTLAQGKPVNLFEDQCVSPSHATNVAAMVKELGERRLPGIWHTCGRDVVDRVTFGKRVCQRFGFDPALVVPTRLAEAKLASPRPKKSGLDVSQTRDHLTEKPWSADQVIDELFTEREGDLK